MARRPKDSVREEWKEERQEMSNSAARRDTIRSAVAWLAAREAEVKALNAEIREYKAKHIKGDLGFKLADWNAIYRVSQLDVEDRDALLDTLEEGFAALDIGQSMDWVAAAEAEAPPKTARRSKQANGAAEPNEEARRVGRKDGLGGHVDHAARWPSGEYGHADYALGHADGAAERERVLAMGAGAAGVEGHA